LLRNRAFTALRLYCDLLEALEKEKLQGKPVTVQYHKKWKNAKGCHVLFVSSSLAKDIEDIMKRNAGKHTLVLVLALFAMTINHSFIFSQKQRNKLIILAKVLARNSEAAVAFNDKVAAEEILGALQAEPHIRSAATCDGLGRLFAGYREDALASFLDSEEMKTPRSFYRKAHYHIYSPIVLQGKVIGLIYLKSDVRELIDIMRAYTISGFVIILLCAIIALYVASWLQKYISDPLVLLSSLAKNVSLNKDYSGRAKKVFGDEIGDLMESFNEMLAEIQKRDDALTRSNRDLEQFAYVASHDLQEPLRMVSSYTDLLAESVEKNLPGKELEYMKYLKEGALRASTLIRDLLEYSRARTQQKEFESVRVEDALREALANPKIKIDETHAFIIHDPLPVVMGDRLKLTLLFQNLVSNALKFLPPDKKPEVRVEVLETQNGWRFGVMDNGIGIDPQYAERIFVLFQRLDQRQSYEGTGMGMGLAICKTIVENHGGKIGSNLIPGAARCSAFPFLTPYRALRPDLYSGSRFFGMTAF